MTPWSMKNVAYDTYIYIYIYMWLRCFMSRDVDMLTRAYLVYVRPLLEVNSVIWSPHYKQDIDLIERVQCRFTKRLPGYSNYTYTERLTLLNLPSFELRHLTKFCLVSSV